MYLLYLDASGSPEFPPPYGHGRDTNYVLAGLAITDDLWDQAYKGLMGITSNYFATTEELFPEIRYGDLINKRGLWKSLSNDERLKFANDVFALIKSVNPVLFGIKINKIRHFEKYKWGRTGAEHPRQLALRYIVPRFSKFLQRVHNRGIMVYDSETTRNDAPLREFLSKGRLRGVVLDSNPFFDPSTLLRTQNKLEGILETIFFIESKASPLIQLTDFCAYAIWGHFERGKSNRFNEIYPLFDHVGSTVYGLLEWPP